MKTGKRAPKWVNKQYIKADELCHLCKLPSSQSNQTSALVQCGEMFPLAAAELQRLAPQKLNHRVRAGAASDWSFSLLPSDIKTVTQISVTALTVQVIFSPDHLPPDSAVIRFCLDRITSSLLLGSDYFSLSCSITEFKKLSWRLNLTEEKKKKILWFLMYFQNL